MNREVFYDEIKQIHSSTDSAVNMKETIVLYPYFMLAQLIQAKKDNTHLFHLNVLFPDRNYLYELLNKNQKPETILSKDNLQTTSPTATTEESPLTNEEDDENNSCRFDEESVSLDELIEKFNKNCPKIVCTCEELEEEHAYEDLCKSSVSEKMNIVSETLAEVYVTQKNYDKAIKIYRTLMARYPEKSSTFADLIEKLKDIKSSQQN